MNRITKAENDGLKSGVDGRAIKLDNAESLLKGIASGKITWSKVKTPVGNADIKSKKSCRIFITVKINFKFWG